MHALIVGKWPPIVGGVSRTNVWEAMGLAESGNDVSVVTDANDIETQHSTEHNLYRDIIPTIPTLLPKIVVEYVEHIPTLERHIPNSTPAVSKLVGRILKVAETRPPDVIIGNYLEPYGVAAAASAHILGVPFGLRHAGSDIGRLARHPDLHRTYMAIARRASFWIAVGKPVDTLVEWGVDPGRIYSPPMLSLPRLFSDQAPPLDIDGLINGSGRESVWTADGPLFLIYGKPSSPKCIYPTLDAIAAMRSRGIDCRLIIVGESNLDGYDADSMMRRAQALDIAERVAWLPFIDPRLVPRLLRSADAVLCLLRDFPIDFHTSLTPREVMAAGVCLVLSDTYPVGPGVSRHLCDRENVLFVQPDAYGIAGGLEWLCEDPSRFVRLGEEGCRLSQRVFEKPDEFASECSRAYEIWMAESLLAGPARMSDSWWSGSMAPALRRIFPMARSHDPEALDRVLVTSSAVVVSHQSGSDLFTCAQMVVSQAGQSKDSDLGVYLEFDLNMLWTRHSSSVYGNGASPGVSARAVSDASLVVLNPDVRLGRFDVHVLATAEWIEYPVQFVEYDGREVHDVDVSKLTGASERWVAFVRGSRTPIVLSQSVAEAVPMFDGFYTFGEICDCAGCDPQDIRQLVNSGILWLAAVDEGSESHVAGAAW